MVILVKLSDDRSTWNLQDQYWDIGITIRRLNNLSFFFGICQSRIDVASSLEFNGFFQDVRSGIVQFHVPFVDTSVKWNYWFYKERFFQFHRLNVRFYWQRLSNFVYIFWYLLLPVEKNAVLSFLYFHIITLSTCFSFFYTYI